MAEFNPQIPDSRDPGLPNIRPIQDIPANQSSATILSTLSSGLGDAVNVVDTAIKSSIRDKAYAGVDPQREQFTAGLEKIKSQLDNDQSVVPAPVQGVSGPQANAGKSLLDANAMADEDDVPEGLESGLDRIRQLSAAKAAGSAKLNDTQYAMETLSVAKNLRAQYGTGYRDYIDSEVSKASGLPVANSYYQNLMLDINRQMSQMNKTKDEIGGLMLKNMDAPGIAAELASRRTGGQPKLSDAQVYQTIGDWQNLQTKYKIDAAARASADGSKSDAADDVARKASVNFSNEVNLGLKSITAQAGIPTAGKLMDYLTDTRLGKHPEATQPEIDQRIGQLEALAQQQRRSLWSRAHEVGPDGESIASKVGDKKLQGMINDAMYPYDTFKTFAVDKDTGPAFMTAHLTDSILNQDKKDKLLDVDVGQTMRQLQANRAILGDGAFPEYLKAAASGGFKDPLTTLLTQEAISAIAPVQDVFGKPLGEPRSMIDAVKHAKTIVDQTPPEYFDKTIRRIESIADPTIKMPDGAKDKMIQYTFNPKNRNLLDELNKDYKDPRTGQWVKGQYAAFNILSAPKITQAVRETALAHPENYSMYQDTLEEQFGKLYRSDLQTLNKVLATPYVGVHFSFDSDRNAFGLVNDRNQPIVKGSGGNILNLPVKGSTPSERTFAAGDSQRYVQSILDTLDKVNTGAKNLAYVHQQNPAGPVDTPQYLLRVLQSAGFRPGENITNATEGMTKAIIKSQSPEMTHQELTNKILNFAPKDSADLASFLRSPAGQARGPQPQGIIKGNLSDQPEGAPIRTYR